MEFHEISSVFPLMNELEIEDLSIDIKNNGLNHPIMLYEGKILDGRNRYIACLKVGIKPHFEDWKNGGSPVDYVISENLKRRHLNETQRAIVAAKLANMPAHRPDKSANWPTYSQPEAAKMINVSERTIRRIKAIEREAPELLPLMESGKMSAHEAMKEAKTKKRLEERVELAKSVESINRSERWNIYCGNIKTWDASRQYDFIITDPPYSKEYLPLYETLAIRAKEWLRPGGLLIAMCGQSYLNEIYEMMSRHLIYYWTACYLLPGQPTPLRTRQVNTSWKPLLIFAIETNYKGKIFGDVFKSDGNDKDFHKWGQSISGMQSIISQICLSGQYILDPFCGAGTTGIAAIRHSCLFDGLELDEENANISRGRLNDETRTV